MPRLDLIPGKIPPRGVNGFCGDRRSRAPRRDAVGPALPGDLIALPLLSEAAPLEEIGLSSAVGALQLFTPSASILPLDFVDLRLCWKGGPPARSDRPTYLVDDAGLMLASSHLG